MSHDLNSQLQFQSNHATTTAIPRGIVPEKQLQFDNSSAGLPPQLQVQVRYKTIEKIEQCFQFMNVFSLGL